MLIAVSSPADPGSPLQEVPESEANKALVRRFLSELWNKHNLAIFDELTLYPQHPAARPFLVAFPDIYMTIDDQIAAGDKVVSRVTFHATHQGAFAGVAPTYKSVTFTAIFIHRVEGSKLTERGVSTTWRVCYTTLARFRATGPIKGTHKIQCHAADGMTTITAETPTRKLF